MCWKMGLIRDFNKHFESMVSGWEKQAGVRELHKSATVFWFRHRKLALSSFVASARCIIVCNDCIIVSARSVSQARRNRRKFHVSFVAHRLLHARSSRHLDTIYICTHFALNAHDLHYTSAVTLLSHL